MGAAARTGGTLSAAVMSGCSGSGRSAVAQSRRAGRSATCIVERLDGKTAGWEGIGGQARNTQRNSRCGLTSCIRLSNSGWTTCKSEARACGTRAPYRRSVTSHIGKKTPRAGPRPA
eukprot:scaffold14709_cov69-Phaeocystis_antarctica.AAC.1